MVNRFTDYTELNRCWLNVADGGPTSKRHWFNCGPEQTLKQFCFNGWSGGTSQPRDSDLVLV